MRSLRVLLAVLCMALAGCRHKPVPAPIYFTPPKLTEALPLDETTLVPGTREVPLERMERVPLKAIRIPRVRPKRRIVEPILPAPAQPAPLAPVEGIGALTPRGADTSATKSSAQGLLAATDKRIDALPTAFRELHREALTRVENFQKDAEKALAAGDADGANTLATKAKVLLDDLQP